MRNWTRVILVSVFTGALNRKGREGAQSAVKIFGVMIGSPAANHSFLCLQIRVHIIARNTLLQYCENYPEADAALREWYHELLNASFANFNELKVMYGNASLVADDRVVFNIMGNKFRLVVCIVFPFKTIQIKWFGAHAAYDKTDVTAVAFKKK